MKNKQFTPTEWLQSHRLKEDGMYSTEVYTEDGETIATIHWYPMPHRKEIIDGEPKLVTGTYREANAKLIASAPDLLKALQMFVDNCYGTQMQESDIFIKGVKAIEKALN